MQWQQGASPIRRGDPYQITMGNYPTARSMDDARPELSPLGAPLPVRLACIDVPLSHAVAFFTYPDPTPAV